MPWHIEREHSDCPASEPWAVVLDETGEAVGCHETESDARSHLAALVINVEEDGKMEPKLEHKTFALHEFKIDAEDGPGSFEGYGAVFNNVDKGGDVILPGAFKDVIPEFLKDGFAPVAHNWMNLPIATFSEAKEDDKGLFIQGEFHSTQAAQDARIVMSERLDRGKSVGLSIGYLPDYEGDGVEFRDDGVRVLKKIKELPEVSFVTLPMNREAVATSVKSEPMTFSDESDVALAATEGFVERAGALAALRLKEGRVLSESNRKRLQTHRERLAEVITDIDEILAATAPAQDDDKAIKLRGIQVAMRARELGIPIGAQQ